MGLKLLWDGSDLDDITKYYIDISKPKTGTVGAKLTLKTRKGHITCYAWKYRDDIPLVVDELKPLFGLNKIGRHKCIIHGVKLLLAQIVEDNENETDGNMKEIILIREHVVFRYLFGVITRGNFLWLRPSQGITSYKESTITFTRESSNISICNINKWFDEDRYTVISTIKDLLLKIGKEETSFIRIIQFLRMKIDETIKRVNPELIFICNGFMSRIMTYLSHIQYDET